MRTDMSAFIYDDKGRTKESLGVHELNVAPDPQMDARCKVDRTRNDESTWNMIDLWRQLEDFRRWRDEQTRAQAAFASGAYYTQAYTTPQYKGASTQAVPYHSYTQAPRYHTQNASNTTDGGYSHPGVDSPHKYTKVGAQKFRGPTPGTFCHTCGEEGHWRRHCPQTHPGQTLRIKNTPGTNGSNAE